MTSAFTPSDIVINPSTVVHSQDIKTPLTIIVSGVTNVYVPFSATSLCSVELQFSSAYTGCVTCYLEKLTNPQNVNNLYALHFSIQKYRYLPGEPSSRSVEFNISASTCNVIGKQSTFSIIQNGCEIESAYITFTAQEANSTIGLQSLSSCQTLWYSTDLSNWTSMTTATTITLSNSGDSCYVRGILSGNNTNSDYTRFNLPNMVSVSGNINSLWNYIDLNQDLYEYCGYNLFYRCTGLVNASELTLGTSATTLARDCYRYMFYGCSSLTTVPSILPATTVALHCYEGMFSNCTSLTTAPELPATTLGYQCYYSMFWNCSSLTTAPELPATTLANGCYEGMFWNCSSLNYIKCLATDISASDCTSGWVRGVASSGTFVKAANMTGWTTGVNGIPTNWTVEDANIE